MNLQNTIWSLTPEQVLLAEAYQEDWIKQGLEPQTLGRSEREEHLRLAYDICGLTKPARIIWVDSPLAGTALALAIRRGMSATQFSNWLNQIEVITEDSRATLVGHLRDIRKRRMSRQTVDLWPMSYEVFLGLVNQTMSLNTRHQFAQSLTPRPLEALRDLTNAQLSAELGSEIVGRPQAFGSYGPMDLDSMIVCQFCYEALGIEWLKGFQHIASLGRACHWCWAFEDLVIACLPPVTIATDDRNRLHSISGPAIEYSDGLRLYAIHGVAVGKEIVRSKDTITVQDIDGQPNAEVRRVLMGLYGESRYIEDSGATILDENNFGALFHKPAPRRAVWINRSAPIDEPVVMLKVLNSTPEPDGLSKSYYIRVPPTMTKMKEAVAWTFGMKDSEYRPIAET